MKSDQLTTQIKDFVRSKRVINPINITLTEKQKFNGIWLDDITSERNFNHFKNVLNRRVFGNGYRRFKKQLSSPNFLYQYFSIFLLVFQVLEVAYLDRDAA
jgi:hypothetical protein